MEDIYSLGEDKKPVDPDVLVSRFMSNVMTCLADNDQHTKVEKSVTMNIEFASRKDANQAPVTVALDTYIQTVQRNSTLTSTELCTRLRSIIKTSK